MATRRAFLFGATVLSLRFPFWHAAAQQASPTASPDGDLPRRYRLTRDRVLYGRNPAYTPELILEDVHGEGPRRFSDFSGDVSGRWISALSAASRVYGESFPQLQPVVSAVLPLQHPEGFFGKQFNQSKPTDKDMSLIWGNGRLLVGLVENYELTGNAATLEAARKLGDFIVRIAPSFNTQAMADKFDASHYAASYICWTQNTEGLAALYRVTHNETYRTAVLEIGKHVVRRPSEHVHGYLCSLRGLMELAVTTQDQVLLARVAKDWQDIASSSDLLVTGAVPELWSPRKRRTEGCAECDWLRLTLGLYRATGEAKYLAAAQRMLFNEFAMNQFSNGDFGHVVLDDEGAPQRPTVHAWWCCTLFGFRAFSAVTEHAFRLHDKQAFLALPVSATFAEQGLRLVSESRLEQNGTVRVQVLAADGHGLQVEQPTWAGPVELTLNGSLVNGAAVASVRAGDRLEIRYPMEIRQEQRECGTTYQYGPWLLGASTVLNNAVPNELERASHLERTSLRLDTSSPDTQPFAVPVARVSGEFQGEEYPEQQQAIHLQAVAEQTGLPPATWQLLWGPNAVCQLPVEPTDHPKRVGLAEGAAVGVVASTLVGWALRRKHLQNESTGTGGNG